MASREATRTANRLATDELFAPRLEWSPDLFGLVVDTREQRPWAIPATVPYRVEKLEAGDYSVIGHELEVAIERKSLADYVATIFHEEQRTRFSAELRKLARYKLAAVVVEASLEDVRRGRYRYPDGHAIRTGSSSGWAHTLDRLSPERVLLSRTRIFGTYGVHVEFAGSTRRAAEYAFNSLRAWWQAERQRSGQS